MKKHKVILGMILSLLIAVMCICPVSADIIVDEPEFSYEISEQKLNTEVTIGGGSETAPASKYSMDIVILLDISKSMEEKYNEKTRLDIAKGTITEKFLPFPYEKIRVGLVTFAKYAKSEIGLTRDLEEVRKKVEDAYATDIYTNLGGGIEEATKNIKEREDKKPLPVIIIFSDGWYDKEVDPIEKAKLAAKEGITIYTVGIGKREEVNEVELRKIAEEAKGKYYYVEDLPKVKKNDPLETVLGMDESLSATNLVIKFEQADALLDYFSYEHPIHTSSEPATNPPVLIERDKFEFVVPKMEEGQKVTFIFDVFPLKGGDVNAATLKLSFIDKNGPQARDKLIVKKGLETPTEVLDGEKQKTWTVSALLAIFVILTGICGYNWMKKGKELASMSPRTTGLESKLKNVKNVKEEISKELSIIQGNLNLMPDESVKEEMKQSIENIYEKLDEIDKGE